MLSGRYAKRNRPKIGSAGIAWLKILQTLLPDDPNLHQQADRLRRMIRHDGLDDEARLAAIFDPDLSNLSDLDIGFFDKKAVTLPDLMVPDNKGDLFRLCRQLIDKGEDVAHIREMTKSFPRGIDLEAHSFTLFDLREKSDELYRRVVQGYHGEAIILFKQLSPTYINVEDFKALLSRQNLIWCAMDVQMVTSGARATSERPFAGFLIGNMKEAKGATILRLMRGALATLKLSVAKYNTLEEKTRTQKSDQRLRAPLERLIGTATKRHFETQFDSAPMKLGRLKALRRGLDQAVMYARAHVGDMQSGIKNLETTNLTRGATSNKQRTFHQIWHSNLSSVAGTAVALIRFASAEQAIDNLVDQAFGDIEHPGVAMVQPLAPPGPISQPLLKSVGAPSCVTPISCRKRRRKIEHLSETRRTWEV